MRNNGERNFREPKTLKMLREALSVNLFSLVLPIAGESRKNSLQILSEREWLAKIFRCCRYTVESYCGNGGL